MLPAILRAMAIAAVHRAVIDGKLTSANAAELIKADAPTMGDVR
jgi:hypothetical protein